MLAVLEERLRRVVEDVRDIQARLDREREENLERIKGIEDSSRKNSMLIANGRIILLTLSTMGAFLGWLLGRVSDLQKIIGGGGH